MSAFSESALLKKLNELNISQQSIQTLSLWLIHHRKHHDGIVKTWYRELQKAKEDRKLTFMYLANDVIQNSKRKGPEYGKTFGETLGKAFKHISSSCVDEKTFNKLDRILSIWEERGVYDGKMVKEFYLALHSEGDVAKATTKPESVKRKADVEPDATTPPPPEKRLAKEKDATPVGSTGSSGGGVKTETIEVNGKKETHITLSPHAANTECDPPEPAVLIKALQDLENSASSDAMVREKIANLPPEISEPAAAAKLADKEAASKLLTQIKDAVELLNEYNGRLANEMADRKKLAVMLRDFQQEQKELLVQAEQRLEEYGKKLQKMKEVQKEIRTHLNMLPEVKLPDSAPLPSAGDLFNLRH